MAKFLDKTQAEWDDLVEKWHANDEIGCSLREYLELSEVEYLKFVHGIRDKDISDEDVYKRSSEIAREVAIELVIKPKVFSAINHLKPENNP